MRSSMSNARVIASEAPDPRRPQETKMPLEHWTERASTRGGQHMLIDEPRSKAQADRRAAPPAGAADAGRQERQTIPEGLLTLAAGRIAIEGVEPEIDGGRFPAKAVVG